jgi:hypothetical protein
MSISLNDLLMLTNSRNQSVYGTVFGTHEGNATTLYIPSWMTFLLDILDPIQIGHVQKKRCTVLQLKPHSESFRKNPHFLRLLNQALFEHRSVTKGSRIPLYVENEITYLTIENMLPSDLTTCFLHNCGKVDIQILDALDAEPPPPSFLYKPGSTPAPFAFIGKGRMVGGMIPTRVPPQKAAAEAAKKRHALLISGKKPY